MKKEKEADVALLKTKRPITGFYHRRRPLTYGSFRSWSSSSANPIGATSKIPKSYESDDVRDRERDREREMHKGSWGWRLLKFVRVLFWSSLEFNKLPWWRLDWEREHRIEREVFVNKNAGESVKTGRKKNQRERALKWGGLCFYMEGAMVESWWRKQPILFLTT